MSNQQAKGAIAVRFEGETEPRTLGLRPIGLMAAERKYGADAFTAHPIEAGMFAGWVSAGKPGGDFDAWADTIAELVVADEVPANPPPSAEQPGQ